MAAAEPYRKTPVFDEETLPAALRREHRTKPGVWGVIRVLEGRLRLYYAEGDAVSLLAADAPGLVAPEQPHWVEPFVRMRMQVEFYDAEPKL